MLMNKMAYEMPDYQSFVDGGRQSVRMRTSMDDVTSLGEYVLGKFKVYKIHAVVTTMLYFIVYLLNKL